MLHTAWNYRCVCLLALAATLCSLPLLASDPPDSEVNPQSNNIETTDSTWATDNFDIRHVIDPGDGLSRMVFTVAADGADDLDPRLTIAASGDTWVVWWRDDAIDEVLIRKRSYTGGTWSEEALVSKKNESSREPEILHDGTSVWVAYRYEDQDDTAIAVRSILDGPDPVSGRVIVSTTSFTGDVDVQIHFESSHLWMTWVDGASNVGWSEYDYTAESWDSPAYESYATDSVEDARGRIRSDVLGQ